MASRPHYSRQATIASSLVLLIIIIVSTFCWYYLFVTIPKREKYCTDHRWEYIEMDRGWACIDPNTRQLFK